MVPGHVVLGRLARRQSPNFPCRGGGGRVDRDAPAQDRSVDGRGGAGLLDFEVLELKRATTADDFYTAALAKKRLGRWFPA